MSEAEQQTLKRRFRTAQKLIAEKRYDAARQILQQINHPQAQLWLQKIEGKTEKTGKTAPVSGMMVIFGLVVLVIAFGLLFALMLLPRFMETLQQNPANPYEMEITANEIVYANVVGYCSYVTGYGDEFCLDWADLLVTQYAEVVHQCFDPYTETVIMEFSDYPTVGNCLQQGGVPPPL